MEVLQNNGWERTKISNRITRRTRSKPLDIPIATISSENILVPPPPPPPPPLLSRPSPITIARPPPINTISTAHTTPGGDTLDLSESELSIDDSDRDDEKKAETIVPQRRQASMLTTIEYESDNDSDASWSSEEKTESSSDEDDHLQVYSGGDESPIISNVGLNTNVKTREESVFSSEGGFDDYKAMNEQCITVNDDIDTYKMIGRQGSQTYNLLIWARNHFQIHKHKKKFFKEFTLEELLQWVPYKQMKNALNRLDPKLNKDAKQTWKNINSYMKDRKSSKKGMKHVEKLLKYASKSPPQLRDEIYCQLCKQTTKNPKQDSLNAGWKLMCIFCSTLPPSPEFAPFLATYLYQIQRNETGVAGESAAYALKALDRTMKFGKRAVMPSSKEILKIEERQLIPIKIYYLDHSFQTILVSSQTRAFHVHTTLASLLRLRYADSFGLFEMEQIKDHDWEKRAYTLRQKMDKQQKIDDFHSMPMDRPLDRNECIMDIISSWYSSNRRERSLRLIFKCKLVSKSQEDNYSRCGRHIAYTSAVYNVINGYYPLSEANAMKLASIQLQATHGDRDSSFFTPDILADVLPDYLSHLYRSRYSNRKAEALILAQHCHCSYLGKCDASKKYLSTLRSDASPHHYGYTYFRCILLNKSKQCSESDLIVGIGESGIIFVNALDRSIINRFEMTTIISFGHRSNAFLFVSGSLMRQHKYRLSTITAPEMTELLRSHIDLRTEQQQSY